MRNNVRGRAVSFCFIAGASALLLFSAACREDTKENAAPSNTNSVATNAASEGNTAGGTVGDPAHLDAEIERLEKQAEKSPGNAETLSELARAYVRRGNAHRAAQRLREAMNDYNRAQRNDPDNEEAQNNAAEIAPQVEGTPTGEYGEPAPLPISPNVTGGGEQPSPTPKKP